MLRELASLRTLAELAALGSFLFVLLLIVGAV